MKILVAFFTSIMLFAGCATVSYSDKGGRTMVLVSNSGWYLLNLIPLASGDHRAPNDFSCRLLTQTTTLANNASMLDYAATEKNAKSIENIQSHTTDESVFLILLKRHTIYTSAELIMSEKEDVPNGEIE